MSDGLREGRESQGAIHEAGNGGTMGSVRGAQVLVLNGHFVGDQSRRENFKSKCIIKIVFINGLKNLDKIFHKLSLRLSLRQVKILPFALYSIANGKGETFAMTNQISIVITLMT